MDKEWAELDRIEFATRFNQILKPSRPIDSIELLFGREKELEDIEYAMCAEGLNNFLVCEFRNYGFLNDCNFQ